VDLTDRVREHLPAKYRELAKFIVVGGSSWILDTGIFTVLSHTVLYDRVITSKIISVLISMIFNYILNREWSFRARGGRERHHEAMLFFLVSAVALVVNLIPLWLSHYVLGINTTNYSQFTVTIVDFISANVIGTALAMAFRFWAYRRWVFPEELAPVSVIPSVDVDVDLPKSR